MPAGLGEMKVTMNHVLVFGGPGVRKTEGKKKADE
jgi:hypothetical protein